MTWGAVAGAGVSLIGGMMASDAAGEASGAQQEASREATALQREMYEQTRADQAGYRQRGDLAGNRLAYMMGLQPTGGAGVSGGGQTYNKTADQFRQELMGQYGGVTSTTPSTAMFQTQSGPVSRADAKNILDDYYRRGWTSAYRSDDNVVQNEVNQIKALEDFLKQNQDQVRVDESGLNTAVQQAMAQQERDRAAAESAAQNDPAYGSLLRNFSASDLSSDPLYSLQKPLIDAAMQRASSFETAPGYAFRKEEGQKGVENSAAARGGLLSGAALKAIQRYGQDFASNEYGNWFNQSNVDRNYIAGQGDASYNRFNTGTTNQYNRLAGLSGTGQSATNLVNTAGADYSKLAGQNITDAGNARAAGTVAQNNLLTGGITGAYNTYQNNQLMNLIRNPQQTNYGGTPYNQYADIPMQPGGGY